MAIDYDAIKQKFILVAREPYTTELSLIGQNKDTPAVIEKREDAPIPDYPFITIDVLDTTDEFAWLSHESVDINDNPVYFTYKQMLISFMCYSTKDAGNVRDIMNKLHNQFKIRRVLEDIRYTLEGSVVNVFDIDTSSSKLSKNHEETATLNLIFNIVERVTDTSTGVIDIVHLDGELFRDDEDPSPLPITVDAP